MRRLYLILCALVVIMFIIFIYFNTHNSSKTRQYIREQIRDLKGYYYRYAVWNWDVNRNYMPIKNICLGNGSLTIFGKEFARIKDAVFYPPDGRFGVFNCDVKFNEYPSLFIETMTHDNYINAWLRNTVNLTSNSSSQFPNGTKIYKPTFAIVRYDNKNLYHHLTNIFNVFLVSKFLDIPPDDMVILYVYNEAMTDMETMWSTLWNEVLRSKDMKSPVFFSDLIWAPYIYSNPLNYHELNRLPFINEFSNFTKARFKAKDKILNCDKLSILMIQRKDYDGHGAAVSRKIINDNELLEKCKSAFPKHNITSVQLEKHSIANQIRLMSQTDILVGMHGAGMAHIMFLPKHAAVLELFPNYKPKQSQRHFRAMARYRDLTYLNWGNTEVNNEISNYHTRIPSLPVTQRLKTMTYKLCHGH